MRDFDAVSCFHSGLAFRTAVAMGGKNGRWAKRPRSFSQVRCAGRCVRYDTCPLVLFSSLPPMPPPAHPYKHNGHARPRRWDGEEGMSVRVVRRRRGIEGGKQTGAVVASRSKEGEGGRWGVERGFACLCRGKAR